jgi:hypothetical protein
MPDHFTPGFIADRMQITERALELLIDRLPPELLPPHNIGNDKHPRWRWTATEIAPWIERVTEWERAHPRGAAPEDRRAISDWRKELLGDES